MNKRLLLPLLFMFPFLASANEVELAKEKIPEDRASVLRGAEHVVHNCVACHSLKYIKYSDLLELGIAGKTVDEWRGGNAVNSPLAAQMPAEAAAAAFGGIAPPDLSLTAIARAGGARYPYSYLMGYTADARGETHNRIYPGTRMPDVLGIATATDVRQRAAISAQAKEIAAFLNWAADPHAQERKKMGWYVIAYLIFMTALLYLWKRQIWSRLENT